MTVPFLRWVGGKAKLLPTLVPLLPPNYETRRYVEPFAGGGAMFFFLEPREALLADLNQDLIFTYAAVRDHLDEIYARLLALDTAHRENGKGYYYYVRERFNSHKAHWVERASQFIYLNKAGFNGVWRVNKSGKYNVPAGEFKSGPNIVNEDVLRAASVALQGVELLHGDFDSLLDEAWEGDFIYLDPPYCELQGGDGNFTAYNEGGFSFGDQERLAEVYRKLHDRGCMLMLSNSSTEAVRSLYKDFHITEVWAARSVNSNTAGRGAVPELVIRNYDSAARVETAA
jgi:DNA adenine methylase